MIVFSYSTAQSSLRSVSSESSVKNKVKIIATPRLVEFASEKCLNQALRRGTSHVCPDLNFDRIFGADSKVICNLLLGPGRHAH
jgi:hypothetical protein